MSTTSVQDVYQGSVIGIRDVNSVSMTQQEEMSGVEDVDPVTMPRPCVRQQGRVLRAPQVAFLETSDEPLTNGGATPQNDVHPTLTYSAFAAYVARSTADNITTEADAVCAANPATAIAATRGPSVRAHRAAVASRPQFRVDSSPIAAVTHNGSKYICLTGQHCGQLVDVNSGSGYCHTCLAAWHVLYSHCRDPTCGYCYNQHAVSNKCPNPVCSATMAEGEKGVYCTDCHTRADGIAGNSSKGRHARAATVSRAE